MEEKKQIQGIPTDAIIDVQISGNYYMRLHQLLLHYSSTKSLEEFTKALATLKAGSPSNDFEYHLETILTLLFSTEEAAKLQGKIQTKEFTPVQ